MSVSFANQLTPTNWPVNTRILEDATKAVTVAMPVAAAWVNPAHIDLTVATPYPTTETINVYLSAGVSAAGNTGNNCAVAIQHTSVNAVAGDGTPNAVAWTDVPNLGALSWIGNLTASAAQAWTIKLPPACNQFIRCQMRPVAAASDTLSDANIAMKLLF